MNNYRKQIEFLSRTGEDNTETIENLKYPVLMVHCIDDIRIPIYHSDQINENAPLDTLYHKFENCDGHGKAYESNKTYYLGFAKTYFNRIFQ